MQQQFVDGGGVGLASTTTVPPTAALSGVSTIPNNSIPSQDDVTRMIQDIQVKRMQYPRIELN